MTPKEITEEVKVDSTAKPKVRRRRKLTDKKVDEVKSEETVTFPTHLKLEKVKNNIKTGRFQMFKNHHRGVIPKYLASGNWALAPEHTESQIVKKKVTTQKL